MNTDETSKQLRDTFKYGNNIYRQFRNGDLMQWLQLIEEKKLLPRKELAEYNSFGEIYDSIEMIKYHALDMRIEKDRIITALEQGYDNMLDRKVIRPLIKAFRDNPELMDTFVGIDYDADFLKVT